MKANELRIGNYLQGSKLAEISAILESGKVKVKGNTSQFVVEGDNPCLSPIPLTEQWLLDLGFKINDRQIEYDVMYELQKEQIEISVGFYKNEIHTFLFSGDCLYHINHVHSLQNLYFALTGKELTL